MTRFRSRALISLVSLAAMPVSFASTLALMVVDQSGHQVDSCRVVEFRNSTASSQSLNLVGRFSGLEASIPPGEYVGEIACGGVRYPFQVLVDGPHRFKVVSLADRVMRSDHRQEELTVALDYRPRNGEVWWLRLAGVYNGSYADSRFEGSSAVARFPDPSGGRYFVTVMSTGGYLCAREIEMVEFTRMWTFHPAGCFFELDRFAHVVERDAAGHAESSEWGRQMERERKEILRELEDAAKAKPRVERK